MSMNIPTSEGFACQWGLGEADTALKAILGQSLVDEEVLATVLTEVESILNSRPLAVASDDPNDREPLTPNHMLL